MSTGPSGSGSVFSGVSLASGPVSASYSSVIPTIAVNTIPARAQSSILFQFKNLQVPEIRTPFSPTLKIVEHILSLDLNSQRLPDRRTPLNTQTLTVLKDRLKQAQAESLASSSSVSGARLLGGSRRRSRSRSRSSQRGGAFISANPTVTVSPAESYLRALRRTELSKVGLTEEKITGLPAGAAQNFSAGATKSVLFNQTSLNDVKQEFLKYKQSTLRNYQTIQDRIKNDYENLTERLNKLDSKYNEIIEVQTRDLISKRRESQAKMAEYQAKLATAKRPALKTSLENGINTEQRKINTFNNSIQNITNTQNKSKTNEKANLENERTRQAQVFAIATANQETQASRVETIFTPFETSLDQIIQRIPGKLSEIDAKLSTSATSSSSSTSGASTSTSTSTTTTTVPFVPTLPSASVSGPSSPSLAGVSGAQLYGGGRRKGSRRATRRRRQQTRRH